MKKPISFLKKSKLILMILLCCFALCGCKSTEYKDAVSLFEAGDYSGAIEKFTSLGNYKDSDELLKAARYEEAVRLYEAQNYAEAEIAFKALDDYKDSRQLMLAARKENDYTAAKKLYEQENYAEAAAAFSALGDYKDSMELQKAAQIEADYITAKELYKAQNYDEAILAFSALGDYKDSSECITKAETEKKYVDLFGYAFTVGKYSGKPVKWIALDVDLQDMKILLLSEANLDLLDYPAIQKSSWEDSPVREWLNNEFMRKTFSEKERDAIATVCVKDNVFDQVFLLDSKEANKYMNGKNSAPRLTIVEARYSWWLRDFPSFISYDGKRESAHYQHEKYGIRPAFWMDLESELFQSQIINSKEASVFQFRKLADQLREDDSILSRAEGKKIIIRTDKGYISDVSHYYYDSIPYSLWQAGSVEDLGYVFSCTYDYESQTKTYYKWGMSKVDVPLKLEKVTVTAIEASTGTELASETVTAHVPDSVSTQGDSLEPVIIQIYGDECTKVFKNLCRKIGLGW